jgi:hypothetical protein
LDKAASHSGDGHYAKTGNFLTGEHVNKTTGRDLNVGGVSVDQLIAQRIGDQTPLPSLEIGVDPVTSGIDGNVGYTRLYGSYISWRAPSVPVARELDPRAVYQRLFGQRTDTAAGRRAADDERSLLDLALGDAHDLRGKLGRDDQTKVDEYLESVRSVEKRMAFASRPAASRAKANIPASEMKAPDPRGPHDYQEHVRLMLDMMILAFWSDATRVSTFMFANDVSGRNFSFVDGVKGAHHQLSHHSNQPFKIEQYRRINRWHVEQFAWMIQKMRGIREGERTLLDNSMLMFGSSFSDGNRHDPANLPILLAGRGGGGLRTGRHLASKGGTPLCNLYLSMLDRAGVTSRRFGDSTGRLAGLD